MTRADQVRNEIRKLEWGSGRAGKRILLDDIAVVARPPDVSLTFDRKPFLGGANVLACTTVGFLAGLALAAPFAGAAIGALLGGAVTAGMAAEAGISDNFVREVERLMRPGTSALFILDDAEDMEVILHTFQGLVGTVLRTNVDPERAKLIQSTLAGSLPKREQSSVPPGNSTSNNGPDRPSRVEADALGTVNVPADHLWGAQTQRSHLNFLIGVERYRWGRPVIRALGVLKKCAALANEELDQLPHESSLRSNSTSGCGQRA